MSERDQMAARAKEMLARVEKRRASYRGSCGACKYSRLGVVGLWCANPIVQLHAFELTDDASARYIVDCSEQRDVGSLWGEVFCGPDGLLFEPSRSRRLKDFIWNAMSGETQDVG